MKYYRLFLFLYMYITLTSCSNDGDIASCEVSAYTTERQDIQQINEVVGTIAIASYKNADNRTESFWYIKTENFADFLYLKPDTFWVTGCQSSWIEGIKVKFSGTVEEFCSNLDPSVDGNICNPIIISEMEKIPYCEIPYTLDNSRNPPLINTQWQFVGFQETDGNISYPTCTSNNMPLRFSDEIAEGLPEEKVCHVYSGSGAICNFSYKESTEGLLTLRASDCIFLTSSCANKEYGTRFDDAMLNPDGIETTLEHNLLRIESSTESAILLFKEVVD